MDMRTVVGRGVLSNPAGRFAGSASSPEDDGWGVLDEIPPPLRTHVAEERARTILSRNRSPDLPFSVSLNPYRGCEHGCVYCYARPTHAYMDLSPGLDFESRLFVKPDAPKLLEAALRAPGYRCEPIAVGANTDAYQPVERRWRVTRAVIEVLAAFDHPFTLITKSALVERDLDLLGPLAERGLGGVCISVTTLERGLARRLEPRAASPRRRLETIRRLTEAGVPVGVIVAPLIPGLNDHELEAILEAGRAAGARAARIQLLRLPHEVGPLFEQWLAEREPLRADRVMGLLRQCRGGALSDARFGTRMSGQGPFAQLLTRRFEVARRRLGFGDPAPLRTDLFQRPARSGDQMPLW